MANSIGTRHYTQRHQDLAAHYYREAIESSPAGTALWLTASLNLARTHPPEQRLELLTALRPRLDKPLDAPPDPSLFINLGAQASALGQPGRALAHESLERARVLAADIGSLRLQVEALDALSHLYESAARWTDTHALIDRALELSHTAAPAVVEDLQLQLEWRRGRVFLATGQRDPALAAFQRAVELAEKIRQDLPIEFLDGRSSYQSLLEPLHLGYVTLLLDALVQQPAGGEQRVLGRVRDAVEMLRQSEMQDFLGDRCTVEESGATQQIEPGVAIFYPILLKDRIELLVETAHGLSRRSVALPGAQVRALARDFAAALRAGETDYLAPARALHDILIEPLQPLLAAAQIRTLVVAADGELRLVPFAALRDEAGFLIERYAIVTITGMRLTNLSPSTGNTPKSLLAGMSEPGDVVYKLADADVLRDGSSNFSTGLSPGGPLSRGRSLRSTRLDPTRFDNRDAHTAELRKNLALPGVKAEIEFIGHALTGQVLLDEAFTVDRFRGEAEVGGYRVVHIASHGVFGGSAASSFILAYDDLLSINRLQSVLQSEIMQRTPIELLTLSACETAEGNDRAPLGIAGAAIRARAKSVLGTLWPVEDNAARMTMETFYAGLADRQGKAAALQQAQIRLVRDPNFNHPFFWAPFSLIGNWR